MKLIKLDLEKFCAFKKASFEFSPGINVLIGANGTGKSHLMKLLYSILKANEQAENGNPHSPNTMHTLLAQKLLAVFRPDPLRAEGVAKEEWEGLGRLVFRSPGSTSGRVSLETDDGRLVFNLTRPGRLRGLENHLTTSKPAVFLPAREAFSMYEGFIASYKNKELAFDETYFDLCVALGAAPARGRWPAEFSGLNTELEDELGGKVHLLGGRFYVYSSDGVIESHLLAEGLRKLGTLFRLMQNGSLTRNSFLFWDEPEANLNPRLVTLMSRMLCRLASSGVQVFVASHDYLLTHELSLAAEYPKQQPPELQCLIRFFALSRGTDGAVSTQQGDILADLKNNPILDEFSALYDRRSQLFDSKETGVPT
jgi:energy-coupling factor transporter ATP-binding protein EcfA2